MKMGRFSSIPYADRTDPQKAETQFGKALGLLDRQDWSAAVVRAVTATEIGLNFAIRREHEVAGKLDDDEVNKQLRDANGVSGKFGILRELRAPEHHEWLQNLKQMTKAATLKRNSIVHSGEFCDEADARAHVESCKNFVDTLLRSYDPSFELSSIAVPLSEDPGA